MNVSFQVKGHYGNLYGELGTSPDDILARALVIYGAGATYNEIESDIALYTHFCETIIVHGANVKFYLDYRVNPNAYDGELYQINFDTIESRLITMGIIISISGGYKFNYLVGADIWEYIYDESTSSLSSLCQFAKCMYIMHLLNLNLNLTCVCPTQTCEEFDNLILNTMRLC